MGRKEKKPWRPEGGWVPGGYSTKVLGSWCRWHCSKLENHAILSPKVTLRSGTVTTDMVVGVGTMDKEGLAGQLLEVGVGVLLPAVRAKGEGVGQYDVLLVGTKEEELHVGGRILLVVVMGRGDEGG